METLVPPDPVAAAPPPRPDAIERSRLVDRVRGARAACVLVVAPAGYGKTTLLAQWAGQDQRRTVWIALDERHNDAVLLAGLIADAVAGAQPLGEHVSAPLNAPAPDVSRVVVPRLCRAMAERGEPLAIVLDDVHRVSAPEALACVEALAEGVPAECKLVLASRTEPEIGVGRLRAEGRLDELRTDDLAMTRGEARLALAGAGRDFEPDLVIRLVELTEGWPAALQLAGMTLGDSDDPDAVVDRFDGDERFIADYIRAEVIENLDPGDREFLTQASILETLTGEICDAVLERRGSGEVLRRLSRSNLLLSPLDSKDVAFRVHALLRGMLAAELHRAGAEAEAELHRRASTCLQEHGDLDEAAEHAIATGDVGFAAERIWRLGAVYAAVGRRATVASWLSAFSEDEVMATRGLAVVAATCALVDGDGDAIARYVGETTLERDSADSELAGVAEILRVIHDSAGDLLGDAVRLDELHDLVPADGPWRALCRMISGSLRYVAGDLAEARPRLEEAMAIGAMRAPAVQAVCIGQSTMLALDEGRHADAEQLSAEGMRRIALCGIETYAASALTYAIDALLRARRGEVARAGESLSRAEGIADAGSVANEWFGAEIRVALARAQLALGDADSARRRIGEAAAMSSDVRGAVALERWIDDLTTELDQGGSEGRWPLTPAELRLLQLLPTHLSFPEIAEQLIVSTNTVKTQARSIYRKLDVSSRTEAVESARVAGLLNRPIAGSPRSD